MRVAIDLTALLPQATGVDHYLLGLVRALGRTDADSHYRVYVNREDRSRLGPLPDNFEVLARSLRPRAARLAFQQVALPALVTAGGVDVVHSPSFIGPLVRGRARHVLTIHDMTSFSHPALHTSLRSSAAYRRAVLASIRRADRVSVPSEFVARDVSRWAPDVPAERIRVVRPGAGEPFRPRCADDVGPVLRRLGVRAPYVLFVGTVEPRKNVLGLIDAFADLVRDGDRPEQLVIAGKQGWGSAPVRERLARPDVAGRARLLDYVDPADLPALYAGASVFAFPSFGEGFGFPPLEAMASGVPVVASDCSSLRENAAGAAELVAPGDTGALRAAIERVLDDESLRRRLVAAGLARAASFSWERMARETAALYSELAVRRGRAPAADGAWART